MSYPHDSNPMPAGYQSAPYDAHVSARPSGNDAAAPSLPHTAGPLIVPIQYGVGADGAVAPVNGMPAAQPPHAPQPPVHLLPLGAVPFNGGVLFHSNVFAHSYSVPGPGGKGHVFYDRSVPMPPQPPACPTLGEQWHSLTRWLQVFVVLLGVFWVMQLLAHWKVGLCMPLLFVWSYLLYREWRKRYQHVELLLLVKFYALGFAPGALLVMLVETVLTVVFAFLCFQDYIADFLHQFQQGGAGTDPTDPGKGGSGGGGGADDGSGGGGGGGGDPVPDGMEFLRFPETPQLFLFLVLLSYISAGCVEESLKYQLTRRVAKYRPSYREVHGYLLYALAAALGFSTVENIGYVIGGAVTDSSLAGIFLNTLGRALLSTPLHLLTAYLIGLQVVRRDVLGESLNIVQVMGWSIFWHGTFDFGLFAIMVLSKHWSSGPDDNVTSYLLMACLLVNCYAGLLYRIWRTRRIVFPQAVQVEHAVDVEAPSAGAGAVHSDSGAIRNPDGFLRLDQQPVEAV